MFLINMLQSRKFWVALFALFVVIFQSFVPEFNFDTEIAIGFTLIIVSYIVGITLDPGGGWSTLLKSRKFWASLVGLVFVFLRAFNVVLPEGIGEEAIITAVLALSTYVLSIAVIDNRAQKLE